MLAAELDIVRRRKVLALPRVKSSPWYVRVFAGYALVVVACALTLATLDALRFKPGGEFSTPTEHFLFTFVLWGGALLVLGAGPLALVLAPFLRRGRPVRLPALVGFVFALALVKLRRARHRRPLRAAPVRPCPHRRCWARSGSRSSPRVPARTPLAPGRWAWRLVPHCSGLGSLAAELDIVRRPR